VDGDKKNMMKQKITIGSILAAFLTISMAFIQPVSAQGKEPVDLIQISEYDMQEIQQLVEMISSDKQVQSLVEPLLQDSQIISILEQMQVATGPDEMYAMLTELETILIEMDFDLGLVDLLLERYGPEFGFTQGNGLIWILIELILSLIFWWWLHNH